jgi:hypothetical protein
MPLKGAGRESVRASMPRLLRLAFLLPAAAAAAVPDVIDFNFHVKPILSDRCFLCHGPDEKNRKAKLRLDRPDDAFKAAPDAGEGWQVIRPGDPARSLLMARIESKDPDEIMPPPESHLTVSADEREILRRWISAGAAWSDHWAFQEVKAPAIPQVPAGGNAIDAFVADRLAREGKALRPQAPPDRLLRRASFALTGLPPSDELRAAAGSGDPADVLARAVDHLLAQPSYGERMAADWCDIARYADTYGYQNDRHRDVWPWRDWVIRAFNDNLPYDQFITWQLAGDLLEGASRDQRVATAFNRLHRQTNEGGSVEEEFRVEYVNDRVTTYGTAFLGLTLECSRCHDHKYDPVAMRDFYALSAFFQNIDESGLYAHFTDDTPTPALPLTTPDDDREIAALAGEVSKAEAEVARLRGARREAFTQWPSSSGAVTAIPGELARFQFEELTKNEVKPDDPAQPFEDPVLVGGREGQALQLDGENGVNLNAGGGFPREQPFTVSLWMKTPDRRDRAVVFHRSRAWTDAASRGYQMLIEDGRLSAALIHFWPGNAICVQTREELPVGSWVHVAMVSDGSSRAAGLKIFVNGKAADCLTVKDHLTRNNHGGEAQQITIGQRFRDRGFKGGEVDDFRVFARNLSALEIAKLAGVATTATAADIYEYWLGAHDPAWQAAQKNLQDARSRLHARADRIPSLMVMEEMAEPRTAHVLQRGAYDARGETVTAGVPAALLGFDPAWPRNRLGLARWTTDRRQPLTARVVVNRLWAQMFGRGLVSTVEDFGNQGSLPTHPELLDFLAVQFMEGGWNVKALLRMMATSLTWAQESGGDASLFRDDPENVLLARGPKFRLPAEMIRDAALASSGLLVNRLGGPGVRPYQPAGIWEEKGGGWSYQPDKGDGLYRRSLYTYWRRTAPPPAMETFDAAKREVCVARRQVTATPLQALVLMNDVQYLEAARVMAEDLVKTHGDDSGALVHKAFARCLGRAPRDAELAVLTRFLAEQADAFRAAPAAAASLAKAGSSAPAAGLDPVRVASTAMLVSTLFNHDEFVTLR